MSVTNLKKLFIPIIFVLLIWIIKLAEMLWGISFHELGIFPGRINSLMGILIFPLIHGSFSHAITNTIPLVMLGFSLSYFYPAAAKIVWITIYFIPGIFIWFLGRTGFHIGASGVVYGLWSFIFFSGIIRRDKRSIALSLLVLFIYGSIVVGIFPIKNEMSWEGHLSGFISGLILSVLLRKYDKYKKYYWENEESTDEELEISYNKNNSGESN